MHSAFRIQKLTLPLPKPPDVCRLVGTIWLVLHLIDEVK